MMLFHFPKHDVVRPSLTSFSPFIEVELLVRHWGPSRRRVRLFFPRSRIIAFRFSRQSLQSLPLYSPSLVAVQLSIDAP